MTFVLLLLLQCSYLLRSTNPDSLDWYFDRDIAQSRTNRV